MCAQVHRPHSGPASPWRRRAIWLLAVILLLAAGLWLFRPTDTRAQNQGKGKGGKGAGPPAIPVAEAKAYRGDVPVYQAGLGSVTGYYTVTVRSRVDGELTQLGVREGDFVQRGQFLAEIDPRPFQVQLEQAEGQMARDQAQLENARLDLVRYEKLVADEAAPKQQRDTQAATVRQLEGAVKQDQAAIDNARLQLTYAHVTAPISGRIGLRQVDPGNIVHATDTNGLFVITQVQPIAVLFTIPEDSLPPVLARLRQGEKLRVDAFNRDQSIVLDTGVLETIDNQIDPQTGTSRLKAVFQNQRSMLFPNQFVNVRVLVNMEHNQVIVPTVAIQRGQQGTFVYIVKPDSTVEARPVTTALTVGDIVSIQKGIEEGESVVIDGADKLQPGARVAARSETRPTRGGRRSAAK